MGEGGHTVYGGEHLQEHSRGGGGTGRKLCVQRHENSPLIQELGGGGMYKNETAEVKKRVRSLREADAAQKTVRTTTGRDRLELLEVYQRYVRTFQQF